MAHATTSAQPQGATGLLLLADGTAIWGRGFGAAGAKAGEVCFNTSITGYQEILTDPSYAGQIITFTFPHIGNVGANPEDIEADVPHALGCIVRQDVTNPSSFRSAQHFSDWLSANNQIGISGVDTRALTRRIREAGAPNAVIAHAPDGVFDMPALLTLAQGWPGLEGMDLAIEVTGAETRGWDGGKWTLGHGYAAMGEGERPHVVAIDYGAKHNIFRSLVEAGARVTVVPARTSLEEILALEPAGVFLSNGPGDPAATGVYAVPVIQGLLERDIPIFGICLGHQLLGLAAGARTLKMHQGHRGANHPVKRLETGVVEITSMNHGFAVDAATLPANVVETHVSLFDGSNCGIAFTDRQAFGVQYHPEASPGPQDSFYLFEKFVSSLKAPATAA
ncbi:MAG: carbamoyl phosphate synthase small subunit [Sphingomonadales bacterium RIFCSPHIGHO2_01_FULL_65_20]|uniref:glutamine-hydrolyzing carbamoyl-phosphate synthase small subunit n=3 Tax=unclassified Blastomonas TaxID=2626550 RepID=UPI0008CEA7D5|nr:glutamine-hydrolyzing carbamoyl-phosphate synthase small subunit [Blastomonas sp.]MCH2239232.1 glutamine-hydrolyzing carbamoyl-phosphate synthase small subunit [Blastomonas sp.]OHC93038.1 MAG: carbamoyl phosphate synthase small subunit [Sphingomonadales bacterium RIFCSPHIGHO2_01_FULL_65_20]